MSGQLSILGRPCSVCAHADRDSIDADLLVPARRFRTLAHQYGLTHWSLMRHAGTHLAADIRSHPDVADLLRRDRLAQRILDLLEETEARVARHRDDDVGTDHLRAVREQRATLEAFARLTGLQDGRTEVNVSVSVNTVDFDSIRTVLVDALRAFPEAGASVAEALATFALAAGEA